MNHFLEISQLSADDIQSLIQRALMFKTQGHYPAYSSCTVANLFYENSTRTRVSFELAASNLGMRVINLDLNSSSETKGEVVEDTIRTLVAMGIDGFIIRHQQDGLQQRLANLLGAKSFIINAGDGKHAHPSQAILDMMTIIEQKPRLDKLKIVVLGNIKHSRVANSFQSICAKLGVKDLLLVAPTLWQPDVVHYGRVSEDLGDALTDADVVMCLRVQRERLLDDEQLDFYTYRRDFALTKERLAHAKSDVIVMHPGPMNRGTEIDSDVADGENSLILDQVANGVYARMAILESLFQSH